MITILGKSNGCVEEEKSALLQLHSSLVPTSQHHLQPSPSDCCSWQGIECNQTTGRVISIDLFHLFLSLNSVDSHSRYLNASLFLPFQELAHLSLSHGDLAGFVDINQDYAGLGKLTHLEVLDLSFNRFNSTLLTSLGSLSSLKVLSLKRLNRRDIWFKLAPNSSVSASLSGLCNLKQLQVLDLWNNHFTGELPQCLSNLTSLQVLDLSDNHFTGDITFSPLKSLVSITELRLTYNSFLNHNQLIYNDEHDLHFPTFQLQTLYLSAPDGHVNGLEGRILEFGLSRLMTLRLDRNKFVGGIPFGLSTSTGLNFLDVSSNELSGTIPLWLSNMSSLGVLDLSSNNFVGELPVGFPSPRMTQVYLSKNGFVGPITIDDSALYQLLILDISHNNLTGSVPRQIDKMSRLRYILLNDNNFFGEIPFGMCTLQHLRLIDFSNNFFSGQIPPCIKIRAHWTRQEGDDEIGFLDAATPAIEPMEITTKAFPYSYQGRNLLLMSGINLANNNFSGEIPEEFGDLTTIRLMNLSHNELTGPIPSAFSSLDQMESLDISYNNLTGSIPPQLVDLHSLAVFSVAYNNLSGKTPERIAQFATFDQDCYDGNPFLCGWPLPTKCSTPREMPSPALMPFAEEDSDGEAGIIDMEVFAASFTVSFGMVLLAIAAVLYINENWRRVWFYYVEVVMTGCYYFMVDHLPVPAKFRVLDSSSSGVLSW
ncbi:Receptor-like protein 13 [Linum grandiflorum]